MIIRSLLASVAASAILSFAATASADTATRPPQIIFTSNQAYPETASWSEKEKAFFVSSIRHGTVGKVTLDGKYTPFITDETLVSSVGVLADDNHNTLWVINADSGVGDRTNTATVGKLSGLAAYDETTGARRAYYDLGGMSSGAHFANDIALDDVGNAYVSDSFAPNIFRIGVDGKASIFARNESFGEGNGFNLNGIAWHKDGFLIVGKWNSGELFRVNIADPTKVDKIEMSESLKGADGLHLVDSQRLIVAQNLGADRTVELVSTDGWKSAKVVRQLKSVLSMPSSATQVGDDIYILNSRIDNLFDPKAAKVSEFLLQKF